MTAVPGPPPPLRKRIESLKDAGEIEAAARRVTFELDEHDAKRSVIEDKRRRVIARSRELKVPLRTIAPWFKLTPTRCNQILHGKS